MPAPPPPKPGNLSSVALFAPLVVIVIALIAVGNTTPAHWVLATLAFLGIPLVVLALRRRANHTHDAPLG
jgi:ACR3 family arsenite efflux pump ArsB